MLLRIASVISLAVLATVSAQAQGTEEKPAKEKKVCRSEAETGTILRKRVCRTESEWAQIKKAQESNAQRMLDQRTSNPGRAR